VPVAGVYRGSLNNGGETLVLSDSVGLKLCEATYDRAEAWPSPTESGWTLVLADPVRSLSDPLAWRTSARPEGSPGTADGTPFTGNASADPDGDGLPDLLEYALGSKPAEAASPGPWWPEIDAAGRVVLNLHRDLAASDAVLEVEISSDLRAWQPATRFQHRPLGDGRALESWGRAAPAPTPGTPVFLRLKARPATP